MMICQFVLKIKGAVSEAEQEALLFLEFWLMLDFAKELSYPSSRFSARYISSDSTSKSLQLIP